MKKINMLWIGALVAVVGCVKQHPNRDTQGNEFESSIGGLVAIDSLKATYVVPTNNFRDVSPTSTERPELEYYNIDGSSYTAQTLGDVSPSGMSIVNQVAVSDGVSNIRFLDKVSFETNAPLLAKNTDKVDFLGEPNKTYEIKYKLTPTALLMMKVVGKDEITHHELPYSDNLGNDKFAVPLGGYKLTTLKRKRSLNADRDPTNIYEYVDAVLQFKEDGTLNTSCRTCADFIRLNPNDAGFDKFIPVPDKRDVYPADYFTGEWYFSEGVVNTKPGSETAIGFISGSFDADFRNASKIKFFRSANTIKGYNIAVDEELSDDDAINLSPVISIPAVGKNYKLDDSGSASQLREIEIPNISIEEAPYVKMNFEGLTTVQTIIESKFSILGNIGTTSAGLLKEVMFSEKSFSLTFEDITNGRRLRYSFLKVEPRDYEARRHYKEDRKIFGYFPTVRTRLRRAAEDYREEDFEKNILIQRLNPKKDVVFYFSDLTPKDNDGKCRQLGDDTLGSLLDARGEINYREIGRRAVKYWDAAFKAAGAPNGVKLAEVNKDGVCFDAPLGDLQYNSINMLDTIQATNLLGVGPSLVDPYSGEVINTTMNVHISPFRSIVSAEVREYLESRLGLYKDRSGRISRTITGQSTILGQSIQSFNGIKAKLASMIPQTVTNIFDISRPSNFRRYVADMYHFGVYDPQRDLNNIQLLAASNSNQIFDFYRIFDEFNPNSQEAEFVQLVSDRILQTDQLVRGEYIPRGNIRTLQDYKERLALIEKYRPDFYRSRMMMEDMAALNSMNSMDVDIREKCPEVQAFVDQKLAQASASGSAVQMTSAEENPVVKSCMNKLIPDKILATVVHEMGHNLGLRHNFFGSADPKNFFTRQEIKDLYDISIESDSKLPKSSTSMEYIPSDKDRLYYPGHYDIAAIRYGYANQVEIDSTDRPNLAANVRDLTGNDQATNSGPQGSILANQNATGKIRDYKYCTDHEASLEFDPMCMRHDYGTTPQEVVDVLINDYYEHLVVYGARYDRVGVGNVFRRLDNMNRLKRFYDEWRYRLADYLGVGNEYLDKFDRKSYERKLAELKNDPNFNAKDYLAVRDKIYKFFTDVVFLNNKYCVTGDPVTQQYVFIELEKIRIQLRSRHPQAVIASCEDPEGLVQKYIADKGLQYFGDVGFSLNDYKFKVDGLEAFDDLLDVGGTFNDRLFAGLFLTERSQRFPGLLQNIQPSMIDEPDFYEEFEKVMLGRVLEGANVGLDLALLSQDAENPNDRIPESAEIRVVKYETEGPLMNLLWSTLENAVNNPFVDSTERSTKYGRIIENLSPSQVDEIRESGGFVIPVASGRYLIMRRDNTVSLQLAQAFVNLSQVQGQGYFVQELTIPDKTSLISGVQLKFANAISDLPDVVTGLTAESYIEFVQKFDQVFAIDENQPNFDLNKAFFELQLASLLVGPEVAAYDFAFRELVDVINARKEAGVDITDVQTELNKRIAQMNADIPGFFRAAERAIQTQTNNPNFRIAIPLKGQLSAKYTQFSSQAADMLFENVNLAKRDFELNLDEHVAHFRHIQSLLLGSGGAEIAAQLIQSALTRISVAQGDFMSPGQSFMKRYFPDAYAKGMNFESSIRNFMDILNQRKARFNNPLDVLPSGNDNLSLPLRASLTPASYSFN